MLLTLHNDVHYIYAYVSFYVLNKNDRMDDNGEFLFINGFWVHPEYRKKYFKKIFNLFAQKLTYHPSARYVQMIYWERDNGRIKKYLVSKFRRVYGKRQNNAVVSNTVHAN